MRESMRARRWLAPTAIAGGGRTGHAGRRTGLKMWIVHIHTRRLCPRRVRATSSQEKLWTADAARPSLLSTRSRAPVYATHPPSPVLSVC